MQISSRFYHCNPYASYHVFVTRENKATSDFLASSVGLILLLFVKPCLN